MRVVVELVRPPVTSWRVNAIGVEASASGSHEHISDVHVSSGGSATAGVWLTRSTVVADIRKGGDDYYVEAGGAKAAVHVVECPMCSFMDYLRTARDRTTADNLLSLPRRKG